VGVLIWSLTPCKLVGGSSLGRPTFLYRISRFHSSSLLILHIPTFSRFLFESIPFLSAYPWTNPLYPQLHTPNHTVFTPSLHSILNIIMDTYTNAYENHISHLIVKRGISTSTAGAVAAVLVVLAILIVAVCVCIKRPRNMSCAQLCWRKSLFVVIFVHFIP